MIGDLFDSPWKVLIVAVVLIVLFGSKKLPDAARLHQDETDAKTAPASTPQTQFPAAELTASPAPAAPVEQQSQIDALQQQIRDLQRAATMDPAPAGVASESQRTQQPS
jgi:Sec-independent protein translocase protein TatA